MLNESTLDKIAETYHHADMPDMFIENLSQLFEVPWIHSQIPLNSSILDLGYGDGLVFDSLLDFAESSNCKIVMVEGSKKLVATAIEHAKGRGTITHGFFETIQSDIKFDVILASHVLEHVDEPVALLNHLATLANPGARIVGLVPNKESIHRRLAVEMQLQPELDTLSPRDHLVGHRRVYSLETLTQEFNSSRWKIRSHRGFFLKPLANAQMLNFSHALIAALLSVSDNLPTEFCANIAFVAELRSSDQNQ